MHTSVYVDTDTFSSSGDNYAFEFLLLLLTCYGDGGYFIGNF